MIKPLGNKRPAEILLVEDNDNDVELTRLGFDRSKQSINLHHVKDGEQCLAFLRKEGEYAKKPTPDVILLDLNMPRMNGHEVLMEISRDENLSHLPVVVLTTSANEQEILRMYKLRCSSYIVKPVNFGEFERIIRIFAEYWLTVAVLPSLPEL